MEEQIDLTKGSESTTLLFDFGYNALVLIDLNIKINK